MYIKMYCQNLSTSYKPEFPHCLLHRQLPSKGSSYLSWNLISEFIWYDQHCQQLYTL